MGIKYTNKEIESIIDGNSVKKKTRLFLRDRMGYFGLGFILNYEQVEKLTLSVQTDEERSEWERIIGFGLRIENGFKDLGNIVSKIEIGKVLLSRYLMEIQDFERIETLINQLLTPSELDYMVSDDEKAVEYLSSKTIKNRFIDFENYHLISPSFEEGKFLDLHLTGEGSLTEKAKDSYQDIRKKIEAYLCYEFAMMRKLQKWGLDLPEYDELFKSYKESIEMPVSISVRFSGVQDNRGYQLGECHLKEQEEKGIPYPALRDLVEDYSLSLAGFDPMEEETASKINKYYNQI